jgi:hypothetical protein
MLTFALIESDTGSDEISEKINKFKRFHEVTAIEDNFPFKFCEPTLFARLINQAEVVFEPYTTQVAEVVEQLKTGKDEP